MNSLNETAGMLRFLTAGSVDDGKSTLIGRLLWESGGVYEDQLEAVRKASAGKDGTADLSLITDGLKAEREQAITIDVAYRYFSTPRRKFIIADTPGHDQYTRNMVTGASNADLAVLLVDARKGLLEQTRRHAYIIWLLGIRHIVLAVNKMDLVGYDQRAFTTICDVFEQSTAFMDTVKKYFVPLSALCGENIVRRSPNLGWYDGPTLLELLETVPVPQGSGSGDFRFPVQNVVRPDPDFRGYAGQIVSGKVQAGQEVIALPSGRKSRVEQILLYKQTLGEAIAPQSVVLTLQDHIDLGRGDMLVDPDHIPVVANQFLAELIWMSREPLKKGVPYLIRHAAQVLCCTVIEVVHGLDFQTFASHEVETLQLNAIGKVRIVTHKAMFFDAYSSNRATGSFIMIDPATNDTVGAGMVCAENLAVHDSAPYQATVPLPGTHSTGLTVWFTGLSGAGKTTICDSVYTELLALGFRVEVLDGDVIRRKLNSDLGFSQKDRDENVRRIAFVAQLLASHGVVVLVAAISPYRAVREEIRKDNPNFIEVYVNAPLEICEQRDPKGLYKRARNKEIQRFTGIDDPYEPPLVPEVECRTDSEMVKASSARVVSAIQFFFASRLNKDKGQATPCPDAGGAGIAEQSRIRSNREDYL